MSVAWPKHVAGYEGHRCALTFVRSMSSGGVSDKNVQAPGIALNRPILSLASVEIWSQSFQNLRPQRPACKTHCGNQSDKILSP